MSVSDHIHVQVAFDDLPNEPDPVWTTIDSVVRKGNIKRGRSDVFQLYGAGSLDVDVQNPGDGGGFFDPAVYYKHRQIRVIADDGDDTWPLFRGWIEEVDHDTRQNPHHAYASISAKDATGLLSTIEFEGNTEDLTGVDEQQGWPYTITVKGLVQAALALLSPISVTLDEETFCTSHTGYTGSLINLPDQITGNVWQLVQTALETEHGSLQIGADGTAYLNGRWIPWLSYSQQDPPYQLTWCQGTPDPAQSRYFYRRGMRLSKPGAEYRNKVVAASEWLLPDSITSADVPAGYPPEVLSRENLLWIHQPWVAANANLWRKLYSQTNAYPQVVSALVYAGTLFPIDATPAQTLLAKIAEHTWRLGQYTHLVEWTPPGAGSPNEYLVTPEAVEWEWDNEKILVGLGYSSRDAINDAWPLADGLFTLGHPDRGLGSSAVLAP